MPLCMHSLQRRGSLSTQRFVEAFARWMMLLVQPSSKQAWLHMCCPVGHARV